MNFISYYFRNTPEDFQFKFFGGVHIFILVLTSLVAFLIYKNKNYLKECDNLYKSILKVIAFLTFFEQVSFIYFYFFKTDLGLEEGLPLFTCRIALYTTFFGIILNSKKLKGITVYYGIIGGILALFYPDMYHYAFPHVLYVDFFVEHISILWAACLFVFVEDFEFSKGQFYFALAFTNVFLAVSLIVDQVVDANYAYLLRAPFAIEFFQSIPYSLFVAVTFVTYNFLVWISQKFCSYFKYKK